MKTSPPTPQVRKALVQCSTDRNVLQVAVRMNYKKIWHLLQPDEQVVALDMMATYLEQLAGQMREEADGMVLELMAPKTPPLRQHVQRRT